MIWNQIKTLIKKHYKQGLRSNLFRKECYPLLFLLFFGMYTGTFFNIYLLLNNLKK